MTNKIKCQVRKSGEGFTGIIMVPGLKPTKLTKKDETCVYSNRNSVTTAAKAFATRYGFELELVDNNT